MNHFGNIQKSIVLYALVLLLGFATQARANAFDDFFTAIKRDDAATLQLLNLRGFDLNTRNEKGECALFLALRDGSLSAANYLLSQPDVKVELRTAKGESPLMMAALKGHLSLVQLLIERKAEVNKPGWTPLHYAATNAEPGSAQVVRLLLEHHAYIDAESPNKTTPLMMAAHYGHPAVVKLLLEEGADPLLKNEQGLSAIDFAHRANRASSAELIGAFVRAKKPAGKW